MNRKNPLLALGAWLALALSSATATSAAEPTAMVAAALSGSVEGRVLNLTNGQYLNNARITAEGTSLEAFTDSAGRFRLTGVPAGTPGIKAFYTGFPAQTATVVVTAGATTTQDFSFASGDRGEGKTVVLDPFQVMGTRETDASNIATNEQRFAANIKNVVAADAFGDASEGNIGEIMKHLPGVMIDYVGSDARSISVRGLGSEFTSVTYDGGRMPSGSQVASRIFELEQVSLNSVSRVEVTKVPTPSTPADSLGGSVNLVPRSAFESSRTQFKYRTYLNMNSADTRIFKKTPGPTNKSSYKVRPSFDFNYIAPFTKNFGLVINGLSSDQYTAGADAKNSFWRFTGAGATPSSPYLRQYNMQGSPKDNYRASLSLRADWRPAKDHVISVGVQGNYYHAFFDNLNHGFNVGNTQPLSFGPAFTHGAPGGAITHTRDTWNKYGKMAAVNMTHRYTGHRWEIDAGLNASRSRTYYRDSVEGHFNDVQVTLPGVSRILFDGIHDSIPGKITVLNAAGQPIDYTNLNNYIITNVVTGSPWHGLDEFKAGRLNVKRRLDFLPFEASLKVGGLVQEQHRDLSGKHLRNFTFLGPNGLANDADNNAGLYPDSKSINQPDRSGLPMFQYVDSFRLWELFRSQPGYFTQTPAQLIADAQARITGSFGLTERVTAAYVEGEARFWQNRLRLLTGVRFEKTEDHGVGPLFDPGAAFQRDANGKFLVGATGARIRKPEAGAAGSLEELALTRTFRGNTADRTYDGYYPSLHLTFNLTENLLLRAAYASTFGRPNLNNILPNTTINESTNPDPGPGDSLGTISVVNTGLLPYSAKNYDLALEYYFPQGGLFSVGAFRKDLTDFFGSFSRIATPELLSELGLDPRYEGWNVSTQFNVPESARVTGVELNFNQPLRFLPNWGKHFNFTASLTKLHLQGPRNTTFRNFIPKAANLGLTFTRKPVVLMVKWNYRGRQRLAPINSAPNAYEYWAPRPLVDVNAEYQIARHVTAFANVRNLFNVEFNREVYAPETPAYSYRTMQSDFGIQYVFGLKGSF